MILRSTQIFIDLGSIPEPKFAMTSPQNFLRLCSSSTWFNRVWKRLLAWKGL